mgnify:CR=1 FL=1
MSSLNQKSLLEVRDLLQAGEVTAVEAATACLQRIDATDATLKAFLHVDREAALSQAKELDQAGPDPDKPLWGVPIAIKDVLTVDGMPATCASKILEGFTPFYEATCVTGLKDAGAVILGKLNMDEFAMGSSTENSAYQTTRNPRNTERVPGGSSGGSAASVASGQVFAALGTDTGGSIRQPASFCGCVGVKPTYGRVSRYGLIAYGSSLDQAGPLTRTVADSAVLLSAMAGHDPKDSTSANEPTEDYLAATLDRKDLKGVKLGLPKEFWGQGVDPEVEAALLRAVNTAKDLGAELVEVSLPHTEYAVSTYYIIAMAEASSNLARFDGVRYGHRDKDAQELIDMYVKSRTQGFGEEVQRRIMLGTYVLSAGYYDAYYRKAAQARRLIRQDYLDALDKCDLICGAVSPVVAWKMDELIGDPLKMYLMDIFTSPLNLAGLPGMSLPVGIDSAHSMPVGLQFMAKPFHEADMLGAAHALEQAIGPMAPVEPV